MKKDDDNILKDNDYTKIKTFDDAVDFIYSNYGSLLWNGDTYLKYYNTHQVDIYGVEYAKLDLIANAIRRIEETSMSQSDYVYTPKFDILDAEKLASLSDDEKKNVVQINMKYGNVFGIYCRVIDSIPSCDAKDSIYTLTRESACYLGNQFLQLWVDYLMKEYK